MAWKMWLRVSMLSALMLAGCVQPTPTPAASATPAVGPAYPALTPTPSPLPGGYPALTATAAAAPTQPTVPDPAPTTGAAGRLSPL